MKIYFLIQIEKTLFFLLSVSTHSLPISFKIFAKYLYLILGKLEISIMKHRRKIIDKTLWRKFSSILAHRRIAIKNKFSKIITSLPLVYYPYSPNHLSKNNKLFLEWLFLLMISNLIKLNMTMFLFNWILIRKWKEKFVESLGYFQWKY